MGLFRKKKKTDIMPFKKKTRADLEQDRINMQSELDKIDFETAKAERQARQKRAKSEKRRQTIKDVHRTVDSALDIFDDSALKNPAGTKKPKVLDDPFGSDLRF